jgi:hypothetical protein
VKLFLAWQDPETRSWYPVGRLTYDGARYEFVYVHGAEEAQGFGGFEPLQSFPDLNVVYESAELFPLFSNRVLSRSRPDFEQYVQWLNLPENNDDPIALLAWSGGRRTTDTLEIFPCPEPDAQGQYHIHFFVHGLRHMPQAAIERVEWLRQGDQLLLMHDFQNPHDRNALILRTAGVEEGDVFVVGYCPRYLTGDIVNLRGSCPGYPLVTVDRVNLPPAPLQLRLLCNLSTCWPGGFRPFANGLFEPVPSWATAAQG